ncbi:UNVERIFIED_CONTAM: arcA [Trichonephila clavipes]
MQTPVILIVEDEDVTRLNLVSLFEAEGYKVIEAIDGDDMHDKLTNNDDVNLVVMDINLPGRDNDVDRILGLEIGADDYITKPFNPRELTIRARNLISRTALGGEEANIETNGVITFNGWELDENSRCLTSPSGDAKRLPKGEYRALRLMLDSPGRIFSREQLIKHMTGRELRANDRTVDVTIRRIRKHFESDNSTSELISTIHGEGYRFIGKIDS